MAKAHKRPKSKHTDPRLDATEQLVVKLRKQLKRTESDRDALKEVFGAFREARPLLVNGSNPFSDQCKCAKCVAIRKLDVYTKADDIIKLLASMPSNLGRFGGSW